MDKMNLTKDLEVLKSYFEKLEEVSFAFLFGSRSKGYKRETSDKEYYEIFERSKSLTEEDRENLRKITKNVTWVEYQKDRHKR